MASRTTSSQRAKEIALPRRGDIYLVDFGCRPGSEIEKTRPALVIQNDVSNRHSPITIVAAITLKFDVLPYPTEVVMETAESGLEQRSVILLNQVQSVDRRRLVRRIGRAEGEAMRRVRKGLEISLGVVEIE